MSSLIFLSCGQRPDERECCDRIADTLRRMGFECYVAISNQSLESVRNNIFEMLDKADYFVFIDFKREKLASESGGECRGSLFTNQELAIAAYLGIEAIVLQEEGIRREDGMLSAIHGNAEQFKNRSDLPHRVAELVRDKAWSVRSKKSLTLSIASPPNVSWESPGYSETYFHIAVRNNHHRKAAQNCYAYLTSALDIAHRKHIELMTIEFKWAYSTLPAVRIAAQSTRLLDAFHFKCSSTGSKLCHGVHFDSWSMDSKLSNPGIYKLTFEIVSNEFPAATEVFELEHSGSPSSVRFQVSSS